MSEILETPLWISADTENRCYEIYDNNNDRVASDIEELEQAKLFAAAPEMYDALYSVCVACKMRDHETECKLCTVESALRKARGESDVSDDDSDAAQIEMRIYPDK